MIGVIEWCTGVRSMVAMAIGVIGGCSEERECVVLLLYSVSDSDVVRFISLRANGSAFVAYHRLRFNASAFTSLRANASTFTCTVTQE